MLCLFVGQGLSVSLPFEMGIGEPSRAALAAGNNRPPHNPAAHAARLAVDYLSEFDDYAAFLGFANLQFV